MNQLIRWVLRLVIFFSVAICVVRLLGSRQAANPFFAAIFSNPDGSPCEQPCMFGVRPGKMSESEAVAILKAHPLTRGFDSSTVGHAYFMGSVFNVEVGTDAAYIALSFNDEVPGLQQNGMQLSRPSWADVLFYFGRPDRVLSFFSPATLDTVYPRQGVFTRFTARFQDRASPADPLQMISIAQADDSQQPTYLGGHWQGFTDIFRYLVPFE
jgi:hypothetical protein